MALVIPLRLTQTKRQKTARRPGVRMGKSWHSHSLIPTLSLGRSLRPWSMEGDEKTGWKPQDPKPFLNGPFNELDCRLLIRTGTGLAYASNESRKSWRCTFRPLPWSRAESGRSLPVVAFFPRWSPRHKNSFSIERQIRKIMAASYSTSGDSFRSGTAQALVHRADYRPWAGC